MVYPRGLVSLRVRVVHSLTDLTQRTCCIHVVWSHSEYCCTQFIISSNVHGVSTLSVSHSEYVLRHSLSDLTQCTWVYQFICLNVHVHWSVSLRVRVVHSLTDLIQCTWCIHQFVCVSTYMYTWSGLTVRVVHSLSDLTQCTCRIHVVWSHSEYVLYTVYLISPNVHVVSTWSGLTQMYMLYTV